MLYLQWQDLSACIPDLVLPTTASQSQSGILNALRHLRHLKTTKAPQHLRQLGICAFCTNSRDALLDLQKDSRASTGGTCGNEHPSNRHFPRLCDVLVSEVDWKEERLRERYSCNGHARHVHALKHGLVSFRTMVRQAP